LKVLTCKDASRLQSQSQDRTLRLAERLALRLHLLVCDNCRRFKRQLELIRQACQRIGEVEDVRADQALTPEAKKRILEKLAPGQDDRQG
jgi:hypothetical protein